MIDVASGPPAPRAPIGSAAPTVASWRPRQTDFSGTAELVTRRFYDDKGPRTIRLNPGSAATLGRVKFVALFAALALVVVAVAWTWMLLPLAIILANAKVRAPLRAAITTWLDRVAREAG